MATILWSICCIEYCCCGLHMEWNTMSLATSDEELKSPWESYALPLCLMVCVVRRKPRWVYIEGINGKMMKWRAISHHGDTMHAICHFNWYVLKYGSIIGGRMGLAIAGASVKNRCWSNQHSQKEAVKEFRYWLILVQNSSPSTAVSRVGDLSLWKEKCAQMWERMSYGILQWWLKGEFIIPLHLNTSST